MWIACDSSFNICTTLHQEKMADLLVGVGGVIIVCDVIQSLDHSKHRRSRIQSRVSGENTRCVMGTWLRHYNGDTSVLVSERKFCTVLQNSEFHKPLLSTVSSKHTEKCTTQTTGQGSSTMMLCTRIHKQRAN